MHPELVSIAQAHPHPPMSPRSAARVSRYQPEEPHKRDQARPVGNPATGSVKYEGSLEPCRTK